MERFIGRAAQSAQTSRLRIGNRPRAGPGYRREYGDLQRDACGVARSTALSRAGPVGRIMGQERQEAPDAAAGFVSKHKRLEGTESGLRAAGRVAWRIVQSDGSQRAGARQRAARLCQHSPAAGHKAHAGPRFSAGGRTAWTRRRRAGRAHVMAAALRRGSRAGRPTLTLDGKGYTVVGILPPGLKHPGLTFATLPPSGADVWIPL